MVTYGALQQLGTLVAGPSGPSVPSMGEIENQVSSLKELTNNIPIIARQDPRAFQKAWKVMSAEKAARGPKSAFFDPLSLQYSLGYKDRRYSLTYDTLKRISNQLSVVAAIVNTRIAQIASFSQPYRTTKSLGFIVRHKDPEHGTTASEKRFIKQLEDFVAGCGEPGRQNQFTRIRRPNFEQFLKMIVRDSLIYDQTAFEIVPRKNRIPFEFRAVDGATIRLASPEQSEAQEKSYFQRNPVYENAHMQPRLSGLYTGQQYGGVAAQKEAVQYIQLVNGQIENVYTDSELAFGVRNPRTDIYIQGYGFGEMEQLITILTSMLYAEEYNRRFFTQGAHPKGMLNFKGDNWTPDQLEAFKRQWVAQVAGTENSWKTPITQSEGIEWINMQLSNQDMQFNVWLEYLIKVCSAVFLIDPAEINFDLHGGVQQTPLFESSQEWKLKASRDRGLKPLLRFIANLINVHVIDKIDDHFVFEFAGLDELTEQEKHEMLKEQIASYMTLNEARHSLDMPDLGDVGDLPMNPTLIQLLQFLDQKKQAEEQQAQEQQMVEEQGQEGEEQPPPVDPNQEVKNQAQQQKIQQDADKHPLEMQLLQQKIAQAGQQPTEGVPAEGAPGEQPPYTDLVAPGAQEGAPQEAPPEQSPYTDLVGKASELDFDQYVEVMRKARIKDDNNA